MHPFWVNILSFQKPTDPKYIYLFMYVYTVFVLYEVKWRVDKYGDPMLCI